jgi:hypothetical protein
VPASAFAVVVVGADELDAAAAAAKLRLALE